MSVAAHAPIGREDELRAVLRVLDDRADLPGAVVLHGEAGVGKTTVWLAAIDAARARSYRVLSSRPAEAETGLSYAGLADLLGGVVDEVLPELPPIQRRALEAVLLLGDSTSGADERAVAAAFLGALRLVTAATPVCLAIDDLQWFDPASLATLRFASSRLEDAPIALLLAVRGDPPLWLRRSLPDARFTAIEVGGLSVGATFELLRTHLGATFPRPTLIRIWETSGGNPLFALELAGALQRRGGVSAPGDPLPIPSNLEELLRERLDRLGPASLEATFVVAAVAEPTTGLLEAVLGDRADAGLTEALNAQILELEGERVRFTHPLLGSAVAARQTPTRRRALHARLAEAVPSTEERARHLALATIQPNGEIAATLEAAARLAQARGASAAAAELTEHALRLTPPDALTDRRRRLLHAADRYYLAADLERATSLLERARGDEAPGRERAVILVQLARAASTPRRAAELLFRALAEADDDDALLAEIHLTLGGHMRFIEGVEQGLGHAELGVLAATRSGDDAIRCRALASYGLLHFNAGKGIPEREMEEAVALERTLPDWPLEEGPAFVLSHQLLWSADVERARELARELEVVLEARGDVPGRADALWYLSLVEWRRGNWAEADRCAAADLELTRLVGRAMPNEEFPTAIVDAHLGRVELAVRRAEAAVVRAQGEAILVAEQGFAWILGFIRLSLGDPQGAVEHLRRAHEVRRTIGLHEPAMCFELGDLLEALVATGDLDEGDRVLAEWEPRAAGLDRAWALAVLARGRGLLHAARGEFAPSFACFEQALAGHARTTDPFQHGRTLLALGRTQRRAKKRGAARATLEEALARFEALGAPLWAEQARDELARIGGRAPSRGELTEAERRIAALVADGKSNNEVAAALFLTVHSVETALTRIYRKLGVRSRGELRRVLSNT